MLCGGRSVRQPGSTLRVVRIDVDALRSARDPRSEASMRSPWTVSWSPSPPASGTAIAAMSPCRGFAFGSAGVVAASSQCQDDLP
jgi:hypothetical protein